MDKYKLNFEYAQSLNIGDLLAYLTKIYGKEIYLNSQQLVGLLADLMNEDARVKRFYRRAILDDHLAEKIYGISEKYGYDETRINSLTALFAKNNAYANDFAKTIVDNFLKGISCKEPMPISVSINGKYGFINKEGEEVIP